MDFDFSPEDEAFRAELRAFLDDELPEWWKTVFVDDERAMPFTREFCHQLAARGWLTLSWPAEHGGADGSVWQQAVVREEMWAAGEPRGPQYMNLNYIGPLIMRFGTPEQQARHLPRMAAGDVLWCQGFSEPEAGSDLASLKTRAVRDGDHYVVNGQKIWNSYADAPADHCLLLARTNTEVKKQLGISMFLVDMRTPGITVRPIPSMAGKSEFSEIFFDDAAIPVTDRLGDEDQGWTLVGEGLAFEREQHREIPGQREHPQGGPAGEHVVQERQQRERRIRGPGVELDAAVDVPAEDEHAAAGAADGVPEGAEVGVGVDQERGP